jgi:hypothetical protein
MASALLSFSLLFTCRLTHDWFFSADWVSLATERATLWQAKARDRQARLRRANEDKKISVILFLKQMNVSPGGFGRRDSSFGKE